MHKPTENSPCPRDSTVQLSNDSRRMHPIDRAKLKAKRETSVATIKNKSQHTSSLINAKCLAGNPEEMASKDRLEGEQCHGSAALAVNPCHAQGAA